MALGRTRDSLAGCECDHHRILHTPAWASQCMEPLPGAAVHSGSGCQPQCSVGPALLEIFPPQGHRRLPCLLQPHSSIPQTGLEEAGSRPWGPHPRPRELAPLHSLRWPLHVAGRSAPPPPTHQPALLSSPVPGGAVGCSDLTFGLGHVPTPLSKAGPLLVCGTEH